MYTVLLRELDYAEDFDIAELEIELEAEGKLDQFIKTCKKIHNQDWRMVRKGAQKLSRARPVLHELSTRDLSHGGLVGTRPAEPGCGDHRQPGGQADLRVDGPAQTGQGPRLHHRRSGPARRPQRRQDRRPAGHRGGVRQGRQEPAEGRKIIAPCWIVVTSQEKLDEVVAAIDSKRVELAKLQDRFRHRVDLAPPTSGRWPRSGCWRRSRQRSRF